MNLRILRSTLAVLLILPLANAARLPGEGQTQARSDAYTAERRGHATTGATDRTPLLVAHRGASAYAPEHTLEAYALALTQGADFLEPDLQLTRDGVLICLHDLTLERTTNVADVFPDRFREEQVGDVTLRRWYAVDFTLDELRQLDAGGWFDAEFAGATIPTLEELIALARGKAGIFPETKSPEFYREHGLEMEAILVDLLAREGLVDPDGLSRTPVILQSFSAESLEILKGMLGDAIPLTLLVGNAAGATWWLDEVGMDEAMAFASGVGPNKNLLLADPEIILRAHARGLFVIPYTFRSASTGAFPDVGAEIDYFLHTLGVDGLFTDNPDLFPRAPLRARLETQSGRSARP
jgi:glycerophosphoryl diester phosphodiesterase